MCRRGGVLEALGRAAAALCGSTALLVLLPAPAHSATGSIDHVEARGGSLRMVFSLSDVNPNERLALDSVSATFDGAPADVSAKVVSDAGDVRRTVVLALDVSDSMAGRKFKEARAAAAAFLDQVPDDVLVGLVTFAGEVTVVKQPTPDTAALVEALGTLRLSSGTRLHDGLIRAVQSTGDHGSRSVLVLSDGRDTSSTRLASTIRAVRREQVKVDVVALGQSPGDTAPLQRVADAGNGSVLAADEPAALSRVFADEAKALAEQVLVTVDTPPGSAGREGSMVLSLDVAGTAVTDSAFVRLPTRGAAEAGESDLDSARSVDPGLQVPTELMYAGIGMGSMAAGVILVLAFSGHRRTLDDDLKRRIEVYTREGSSRPPDLGPVRDTGTVTRRALAVAENLLTGQRGLEAALASRLDAAGLSIKPAEWLLLHTGTAVASGLVGLLLGGGLVMVLGVLAGVAAPWAFVLLAQGRRLRQFKAQLADTLQLTAGSLSAGLSLAQSLQTVVNEGSDPVAAEFRRALVEARLGVDLEETLVGVADRMESVDFQWVVMAIRIQRDVGGNLAELLNRVADTIREREYLERQVRTLSAEGRLSVWILAGLPPAFLSYLLIANPTYVAPLFSGLLGWIMLAVMAVLEGVGIFWMTRLVRIEV